MKYPRPFPATSTYAALLIKTWKAPTVTLVSSSTPPSTASCDEAIALNAYSILHDRRIPPQVADMLETHYTTQYPGGSSFPENVMRDFHSVPPHDLINERNHLHGFRGMPPPPKIELLSTVRLTKWLLEQAITVRDNQPSLAPGAGLLHLEEMMNTIGNAQSEPAWKWLFERKGGISVGAAGVGGNDFNAKMEALLALINEARCNPAYSKSKKSPLQWSAGHAELERHRQCMRHDVSPELAEGWITPLGMCFYPGEMFLVFKFPAKEAGQLCRPTHIDAGFYREHFPSPLDDNSQWPAHPMFLVESSTCPDLPLICEYVHPPVRFERTHLCAFSVTQSASSKAKIPQQRQLHWPRLDQCYPSCVLSERLFPPHTGVDRCDFATCGCPPDRCKKII